MCETNDNKEVNSFEQYEDFVLLKSLPKDLKDEILRYVKLKCKEQRRLCLDNVEYGRRDLDEDMYSVRDDSILNAAEPVYL